MPCRYPGGSPGPHPGGSWGVWLGGGSPGPHPGGVVYPSMHWGRPPPWTATATGSTHPTGMHSCFIPRVTAGLVTFICQINLLIFYVVDIKWLTKYVLMKSLLEPYLFDQVFCQVKNWYFEVRSYIVYFTRFPFLKNDVESFSNIPSINKISNGASFAIYTTANRI